MHNSFIERTQVTTEIQTVKERWKNGQVETSGERVWQQKCVQHNLRGLVHNYHLAGQGGEARVKGQARCDVSRPSGRNYSDGG